MNTPDTFDIVGIGIGPFNLGLACLFEPLDNIKSIFLEKKPSFSWHEGMLIEGSHLQTPFISDLVTMADPRSRYSFLNYLKENSSLYQFFIRENFFILREEYNKYCQWVSSNINNVEFNSEVTDLNYIEDEDIYRITVACRNQVKHYYARHIVLGIGTVPAKPIKGLEKHYINHHSSNYIRNKNDLQKKQSITIIGSGQSAAEIFYDLLQDIDKYQYELTWLTRSPRFFPLEYTKFTLEMASPDYVDHFYSLPSEIKKRNIETQKSLYKGINSELINKIYDELYIKSLSSEINTNLLPNAELTEIKPSPKNTNLNITFKHAETNEKFSHVTEGIVLATGYEYQTPEFINNIDHLIRFDEHGNLSPHRNYAVDFTGKRIFLQNSGIQNHGFATPDIALGCYRNAYIVREITGIEHYPIEKRIAFQDFSFSSLQNV